MTPPVSTIHQDDTHRLIPYRYSEEGALRRLTENDEEFATLTELEGATNDRLLGEANRLPGISIHELLFGVKHAEVVNAAFTHSNPVGSRFSVPARGAWYAAFELNTAEAEVAFHKAEELREINWQEPEAFTLVDYLADFRSEFHDIRGKGAFKKLLDPDDYTASQLLAGDLLAAGSAGLVYPSVRRPKGTCLVCFRPALVMHVRKGQTVTMTFKSPTATPAISHQKDRH